MLHRLVLIVFCIAACCEIAFAELEGIAFQINSIGSYGQHRQLLDMSSDQHAAFTSFRIESKSELSNIYKIPRQELAKVTDEESNKKWSAKHGPLIRQINYDLWQRAREILQTEERIAKYYQIVLQQYLRHGRDVRCIASLLGTELTWDQFQSLKSKTEANSVEVENLLASRRREIEEAAIEPFIDRETLRNIRGEEFRWKTKPPEFNHFGFSPFDEELGGNDGKALIRVAAHADVLDALKATAESRKTIAQLLSKFAPDDDDFIGEHFGLLAAARTEPERNAIQQELISQRTEAEEELVASVRSTLSKEQYDRLLQIALQQKLRKFDYVGVVRSQLGKPDRATRRKIEAAAQSSRNEVDYAKTQMTMDLHAKSFDEVLGTSLATSLGKLASAAGIGSNPFGDPKESEPFRERYGVKPTTKLRVPDSLNTPPEPRVNWNDIPVPEGWKLEDAMANLKKSKNAVKQIADGSRKWNAKRDELREEMSTAQRNGDVDLAKSLRKEYSRDYGGRNMFATRKQFRDAFEIAQKDLVKARRIVKKLGGDPGGMSEPQRIW